MAPVISPFLDPGTHSAAHNLGIVQLRRDHLIPAVLAPNGDSDYAEGKVENTRFGSFPHSTLVDQPWGTQVLASVVDTGSRGKSKKRKRDGQDEGAETPTTDAAETKKDIVKAATASSGFAHLIPPTPETWTLSLPHRTQVVYTPDYSYILQRLRVRPGDHLIEAGAGSGSFTHAAVRCVYNGAPGMEITSYAAADMVDELAAVGSTPNKPKRTRHGGVYSFEYHEPRARQLAHEITEHGLDPVVTVTHRDVYGNGFNLDDGTSPEADAIFLDLPAPWQALKHLTRTPPSVASVQAVSDSPANASGDSQPFVSPLNPKKAVRICSFSPCIEQVTKTVAALRTLGWLEIDMVEIQAKRLEVRRERVGLAEEGLRGGNASAASVAEAVQRLRDVEGRAAVFHSLQKEKQEEVVRRAEARKRGKNGAGEANGGATASEKHADRKADAAFKKEKISKEGLPPSKHDRLDKAKKDAETRALYKEGRLVHRTEPELKTHTSYLVFAVLPRQWTAEDEEKARKKYGSGGR